MGKASKKKSSKKELLKQLDTILSKANNQQNNPLESLPPAFLSASLSSQSVLQLSLSDCSVNDNNIDSVDIGKDDDTTNNNEHSRVQESPTKEGEENSNNINKVDDDDVTATIQYMASPLPPEILQQCLSLFELNMGDMYRKSKWGLDMDEKRKELGHTGARFLLLLLPSSSNENVVTSDKSSKNNNKQRQQQYKVLGFAHIRYEYDDETAPKLPITYLYELQIHPTLQGQRLGKKLLQIIELLSYKLGIKKIMLTVFHTMNAGAMKFYRKNKYVVDEDSPSNFEGGEDCDYEILSKSLGMM